MNEWMHTLESYRNLGVNYPRTHGYMDTTKTASYSVSANTDINTVEYGCNYVDMLYPDEYEDCMGTVAFSTLTATDYSWKEYTATGIEPKLTNFYRAVLCAEVTDNNTGEKVGMYPLLWKLSPRRMHLGTYMIQEAANKNYLYNNNSNLNYTTMLSNTKNFQWNLVYDISAENVAIISNSDASKRFDMINASVNANCLQLHGKSGYSYAQTFGFVKNSDGTYKVQCLKNSYSTYYMRLSGTNLGFSQTDSENKWNFIKVSWGEGNYYIRNVAQNKYLTADNNTMSLTGFTAADAQQWEVKYNKEGFYTITPKNNLKLYLNVTNNWNIDGTTISLYKWSGYPTAQTWQIRLNQSGYYNFVPKVSTTRGLTYGDGGFTIDTLNGSTTQDWVIEKVNGGKMIFDGKYRIKNNSNQYLSYSGTALTVGTTKTDWTIRQYQDNYYYIAPLNSSYLLYWDVKDNYDFENNLVQIRTPTSYKTAQTWKFVLQNNDSIRIIPMISLTRNMAYQNSKTILTTANAFWYLEKVN